MKYILSILLLFAVTSYATVEVDCSSPDYSYNPAVKQACEEMQKTVSDAKKSGNERFSELLSGKKAASLKAHREAAAVASSTAAKSTAPSPSNNTGTEIVNTVTQVPAGPTTQTLQPSAPKPATINPPAATTAPAVETPGIPPSFTAPATIPVPSAPNSPETPANPSTPTPETSHSVKYY